MAKLIDMDNRQELVSAMRMLLKTDYEGFVKMVLAVECDMPDNSEIIDKLYREYQKNDKYSSFLSEDLLAYRDELIQQRQEEQERYQLQREFNQSMVKYNPFLLDKLTFEMLSIVNKETLPFIHAVAQKQEEALVSMMKREKDMQVLLLDTLFKEETQKRLLAFNQLREADKMVFADATALYVVVYMKGNWQVNQLEVDTSFPNAYYRKRQLSFFSDKELALFVKTMIEVDDSKLQLEKLNVREFKWQEDVLRFMDKYHLTHDVAFFDVSKVETLYEQEKNGKLAYVDIVSIRESYAEKLDGEGIDTEVYYQDLKRKNVERFSKGGTYLLDKKGVVYYVDESDSGVELYRITPPQRIKEKEFSKKEELEPHIIMHDLFVINELDTDFSVAGLDYKERQLQRQLDRTL